MKTIGVLSFTTVMMLTFLQSVALSQQSFKQKITGAWILVSNDNTAPDGTKRQLFGPNPQGILVLDASGHYAQTQMRPDRPKFAINNRFQGTAEENKVIVQGTVAFYGTWTVDEGKVLTMRLDASLFPNQVGEVSRRLIVITGDEMTMNVPSPGAGGTTVSVYRRAK